MNNPKILVVEDDSTVRNLITTTLKSNNYAYITAANGEAAIAAATTQQPDIVFLDLGLPDLDGVEVIKRIRSWSQMPIIVISARTEDGDKVAALDAGADDYLVKPFSFLELQARIQAMLRRIGAGSNAAMLRCGDLELDASNHRAIRSGQAIALTVKEYKLLECLMQNAGTAISRAQLLRTVWEKEPDAHNTNVVDVYVNYLRQKVDKTFEQKLIHTVTGVGYRIEA